jgi:hypothetical protein
MKGILLMKTVRNKIFPEVVDNSYYGHKIALWVFISLAPIILIRSIIHLFASDGGAGSIAGLDLSFGTENIIFAFGLWGLSQVLYALIQLLVAIRYKSLIPLFYLMFILEIVGRIFIGISKPPVLLSGPPPGGIANFILLPIVILMFILSLKSTKPISITN